MQEAIVLLLIPFKERHVALERGRSWILKREEHELRMA